MDMEPLPTWLSDAVVAAGMTAYADDLYPKVLKESPRDALAHDEVEPPLH
jgi:hypothetical protein